MSSLPLSHPNSSSYLHLTSRFSSPLLSLSSTSSFAISFYSTASHSRPSVRPGPQTLARVLSC
jgi:hypothetical protein